MTLNRVACPECGAGLKSSTGFTPGQAVSCPKCETEFTVEEEYGETAASAGRAGVQSTRDHGDEEGWSYKNSWLRYAVLGVLLVALGVLGYMLYDKRMKENKESTDSGGGSSGGTAEPPPGGFLPPPKKGPSGAAVEVKGGGQPIVSIPTGKGPSRDDINALLEGRWVSKNNDESYAIEYNADGTFSYSMEKEGQPKKVIQGEWKLVRFGQAKPEPGNSPLNEIELEWTVKGKPTVKGLAIFRQDASLGHPLLDREIEGTKAVGRFTKK